MGAGVGMLKIPLITPGAAVGILLGSVMLHFGAKQQGSLGSDASLHSAGRLSYLGHLLIEFMSILIKAFYLIKIDSAYI